MLFSSPISLYSVYLLSLWHFYYDFNSKQHQNVDEFSISSFQNGKKTHTQRKSRGYHNNFMWRKNVNCIGHAVFSEMQEWVQWNFC